MAPPFGFPDFFPPWRSESDASALRVLPGWIDAPNRPDVCGPGFIRDRRFNWFRRCIGVAGIAGVHQGQLQVVPSESPPPKEGTLIALTVTPRLANTGGGSIAAPGVKIDRDQQRLDHQFRRFRRDRMSETCGAHGSSAAGHDRLVDVANPADWLGVDEMR